MDQITIDVNDILILHLNVHSLPPHLNELEFLLDQLPARPSHTFLGISETQLNQTNETYAPTGFCTIPNSREGKTGGGVAIFVPPHIEYLVRSDLHHGRS